MRGEAARNAASAIVWDGEYAAEFKIQPGVFALDENKQRRLASDRFTVQLFRDEAANGDTLAVLEGFRRGVFYNRSEISHYVNVTVELDEAGINALAGRDDVISIHPYFEPKKNDERQDRIVTGFVSGNGIVAGNHLDYLAGKGFTQAQFDASNFSVNVVDDGLDAGAANVGGTPNSSTHFGLFRQGNPSAASRVVFVRPYGTATLADTQGCAGHGTLNSHIVGGYVPTGGIFAAFPHTDTSGYRFGLGVAPFVKLGSSTIFKPSGAYTNPNQSNLEAEAYRDGSRVSSNSWGSPDGGAYTAQSQLYDFLVRDAQQSTSSVPTAGNQQQTIIFAAGNDGSSGAQTTGNPGKAKNVITVGASENVHPFGGNDGCNTGDTGADSLNDIANFSSRGPTTDGRKKPEIVAPGTHITGGVYQQSLISPVSGSGDDNSCFTANSVCGGVGSKFFPSAGQQWSTASSGTSHSTPAVAGGAALVRQYFINQSLAPPSPAMTKAVLMNSTSYLNGVNANDNLWSNSQGMGLMNLDRAFNTVGGVRLLFDQQPAAKFTASGQMRQYGGTVTDGTKPTRITAAWSDAPGATTGNSYVNNLDLEVFVNGSQYLGNVFTGANSVTGGAADARNNAESVFLPAGVAATGAAIIVRVKAINIAGDGVPNDADALDQDFALIGSNVNASGGTFSFIISNGVNIVSESNLPANNAPDPGEMVTVSLALQNIGDGATGNVTATLQNSGGITPIAPTTQNYGVLAVNAAASRNFTFSVPANAVCGSSITLTFQVQDAGTSYNFTKTYTLGMLNTTNPTNSENFDGVTAPALPAGWTSTQSGSGTGWTTSTTTPASAPNAAFAGNPATVGLSDLESPAWNVNASPARLEFKINYDTERGGDGAVLEMKIGAGAYQDIIEAGGSFVSGGYNQTLFTNYGNPLGGRAAWTGFSNGYVSLSVNLPAAANGQTVQFRWRMGTDSSFSDVGVRLNGVRFFGANVCAAPPRNLIVNKTADTNDGSCDATDCSLREALDAADGDNLGDIITFNIPANSANCNGTNCTITLSSVLQPKADGGNLTTIDGATGANVITLSGNGATKILNVGSGVNLVAKSLNFTRGSGGTTGGAIFNAGTLTLTNSALYVNSAGNGGAIYNDSGSQLNLTNVTISGNSASSLGGGIFNGGTVTAANCTITSNSAQFEGGVLGANASSPFTVRNTIIADNTASFSPDANGNFTSQGYNLVGNASGASGFTATGDQTGVNARLAPLGNYGGKTLTHALLDGGAIPSPAINTGTATGATTTDARGASRVGTVDKGAFEVNNTANGGSFVALLPDGVAAYNQTIAPESGSFSYTLASGMLPNGFSLLTGAPRFSEANANQPFADFAPTAGRVSIQGTPTISRNFPFTIALNNGTNSTTINYAIFVPVGPTAASVSVAGRVMSGGGRGVANATVTLTDAKGAARTARTTSFGYYRFEAVEVAQTYIVSVRSRRYQFAAQVVSVTEELSELNFYSSQ